MVTSEHSFIPTAISPRIVLWLAAVAVLASLLALLTKAVMDDPTPSQDIAIMDWFAGWQPPGLVNFFEVLSALTGIHAGLIYGPAGIVILLLMRKVRAAIAFGAVGFTVAVVAVLGDSTLGELVSRGRPLEDAGFSTPSFPSGHVFGSTVFFSFIGFLALNYRLNKKALIPLLAFVVAIIILVGPARVSSEAHFPSDVAAGYLLAALWLLVIIPAFLFVRGYGWGSSRQSR
ncbi:MAG: phosphatase PAP2 family protein [Chloroflexi bacterium]|nr:phosphatase PAP2 family protein [Chloroflexota bacterium]